MKLASVIWLSCLVAAGCITQADYTAEKQANAELATKLENAGAYVQALMENREIIENRKRRSERVTDIERILIEKNDTLDRNAAEKLLKLVDEGEPYDTSGLHFEHFSALLVESALQLRNLNHDLEYNLLPLDSVDTLVYREQLYAHALLARMDTLTGDIEREKLNTMPWLAQADTFELKLTEQ